MPWTQFLLQPKAIPIMLPQVFEPTRLRDPNHGKALDTSPNKEPCKNMVHIRAPRRFD